MSTRATIEFKDGSEKVYIYRGHDGFPEDILPDIERAIKINIQSRFGSAEIGQLIAVFLGETYEPKTRVQNYEITTAFHGDESYRYFVEYNDNERKWEIRQGIDR